MPNTEPLQKSSLQRKLEETDEVAKNGTVIMNGAFEKMREAMKDSKKLPFRLKK
jgi:hypothetical protein